MLAWMSGSSGHGGKWTDSRYVLQSWSNLLMDWIGDGLVTEPRISPRLLCKQLGCVNVGFEMPIRSLSGGANGQIYTRARS